MNRIKLGVVLETAGLPVRPALTAVAKLAVHGVQIDATGDLAPDRLTDTGRREFRNLLRSANLELSALNCPLRRGLDTSEHQQQRIEHIRKAMQLAFDLGCRRLIVPLPKVPDDAASPRALALREALTALGQFGDKCGTQVALEAGLDAGDKVRDHLTTFDNGCLTVTYDPANFLLNGFDPYASLAALAGKVSNAQARDGRAASVSGGPREVPVGSGDVEWLTLIATLESIGYHGFLTVDRESGENRFADVAAGVRFLRRFVPASAS